MPISGLTGTNGPSNNPASPRTGILSNDVTLFEGPPPGTIDFTFIFYFFGPQFIMPPNVIVTTGNPHWTGHAIWVNQNGAGIVVNRKTPSPGNRNFQVYILAMGTLPPGTPVKDLPELRGEIKEVSMEELLAEGERLSSS